MLPKVTYCKKCDKTKDDYDKQYGCRECHPNCSFCGLSLDADGGCPECD